MIHVTVVVPALVVVEQHLEIGPQQVVQPPHGTSPHPQLIEQLPLPLEALVASAVMVITAAVAVTMLALLMSFLNLFTFSFLFWCQRGAHRLPVHANRNIFRLNQNKTYT